MCDHSMDPDTIRFRRQAALAVWPQLAERWLRRSIRPDDYQSEMNALYRKVWEMADGMLSAEHGVNPVGTQPGETPRGPVCG